MKLTIRLYTIFVFWGVVGSCISGCTMEEGVGGTSSVRGKVYAIDVNSSGQVKSEYYLADVRVYIVYGDEDMYGDEMRTHFDGSYEFNDLFKGNYTLYAYSDCDTCAAPEVASMQMVEITTSNQQVEVPDIVVYK